MSFKVWDFEKFGAQTAFVDESGIMLTYSQLSDETKKIERAVQERCLVFSLCKNNVGSALGYTAFLNGGIVPVLLNAQMEIEMLRSLLDKYCPAFLWVPKDHENLFDNYNAVYEAYDYVLLKTHYQKQYLLYEQLGLLLTTSGSTGSPKFVRQSYCNILENAKSIVEYLQLDNTERPITTLPMNYTYGLSIINSHLLVGAQILMTEKSLMQKEFWQFFKQQEATSFGGVPYTYEILDKLRFTRMELPSLRTMTQAGGKLNPNLHQKFAEYAHESGKRFIVMYGQCEATARMGYLPAEKSVEKKGSMGIAIPGGTFKLIDEEGKEINSPNCPGELVYTGKNVTLGYAECGDDLKNGDERNGVLQTGDIAQFDADGYYYIVGRKKRFLKIYGNRVNLDEMDRMIKDQFETECASTGIDDHMYIFLTDDSLADKVRDFAIKKTKLNPAAFKIVVIDKIPQNDSGKVLYKELEEYYQK